MYGKCKLYRDVYLYDGDVIIPKNIEIPLLGWVYKKEELCGVICWDESIYTVESGKIEILFE